MFGKKAIFIWMAIFSFLVLGALMVNMPEKKDPVVLAKIAPYFPYKITKTFGGLDLLDKRTNKRLKLDNAKVYVAYDHYLKKWGRTHLKLQDNRLLILDDNGTVRDHLTLSPQSIAFVKHFFFEPSK